MIKCNEGQLEIDGNGGTLLAELTCIVRGLRYVFDEEFEDFAEEMIPAAVELGMRSKLDEVEQEFVS